jgi:hypothetical protein
MRSRFLQALGRRTAVNRAAARPLEARDIVSFTKRRASFKAMTEDVPVAVVEAAEGLEELTRLDEAIFLLQSAAEIEHALMVQYLYAAFTLELDASKITGANVPADAGDLTLRWFRSIFQIAKEEMAHLLTIQNLLRLLGGPLNFERQDFPFRSDLYPFPFMLEPLTKTSLAKYVAAEMPDPVPAGKEELVADALRRLELEDLVVNRVGLVYARLETVVGGLDPAALHTDTADWQGTFVEWGGDTSNLLILPVTDRQSALDALSRVAAQGEGTVNGGGAALSHFDRFAEIYELFPDDAPAPGQPVAWRPARLVPRNPNTTLPPEGVLSEEELAAERLNEPGRITDPTTRLWANLLNVRYRLLLVGLSHSLMLTTDLTTRRGALVDWCFNEMTSIALLMRKLSTLPLKRGVTTSNAVAGAPFELPYTLTPPDRGVDRWRLHRELLDVSDDLVERLMAMPDFSDEGGVIDVIRRDVNERRQVIGEEIQPG